MKIVRMYTFVGPESWLRAMLKTSLKDGVDQTFTPGDGKSITVETLESNLPPEPREGDGPGQRPFDLAKG